MGNKKQHHNRIPMIRVLLAFLCLMAVSLPVSAKEIRYNSAGNKQGDASDGLLSMSHLKDMVQEQIAAVEGKVEELKENSTKNEGKQVAAVQTGSSKKVTLDQTSYKKGSYPIMGNPSVTVDQMVKHFQDQKASYPSKILSKGGAKDIQTFCQIFYEEAIAEGVKPEVAYAQAMKETGWLAYGGDSTPEQFNFAGLGTTGGGVKGNAFPDVRTGIRAQIQHLKAYATKDKLTGTCVDERYDYVKKGCAPYVEWLGQQENPDKTGWATAENYGYDIVHMIQIMRSL